MSGSVISLADIVHILNPMVEKYFELGVQLGIEVACLKQIEGEHSSHSRRLYEIIHFWQNNNTSTCEWSTLANAVAKIQGHDNLARELRARGSNMKEPSPCNSAAESSDGSSKSIEECKHFTRSSGRSPRLLKRSRCDSMEIPEDTGYSTKSDSLSDELSSGSDAECFDLVPGCGCKDKTCSIYMLCAGGCLNPTTKRVHILRKSSRANEVGFPTEEEDDYEDYEIETKRIQKSFGRFVMDTCNSFKKSENVTAQNLALFIRTSFPVMKPRTDELIKVECLERIFNTVVDQACSWFDYEIIKDMIDYFGDHSDKSRLEKYEEEFKKYARERLPKGKKHIEVSNGARKGCKQLVIKIDKEWEDINFSDLEKLCGSFASILGIRRRDLYLADIREGCIMLTLMIPEEIAAVVFPTKRCLTPSQIQSFKDRGVISLKCGKFCWRAAVSVGEAKDEEGSLTSSQNSQSLKDKLRYEKLTEQAAYTRVLHLNKVSKDECQNTGRLRHRGIGLHNLIILVLLGLWGLAGFSIIFSQCVHTHFDSASTFTRNTATCMDGIGAIHHYIEWWNQTSFTSRTLFKADMLHHPSQSSNPNPMKIRVETLPHNHLPPRTNSTTKGMKVGHGRLLDLSWSLEMPKDYINVTYLYSSALHINAEFGHVDCKILCVHTNPHRKAHEFLEVIYTSEAESGHSCDVVDCEFFVKIIAYPLPSKCSLVRNTTATKTAVVFKYCDLTSPVLMSNLNFCWKEHRSQLLLGIFLQGRIIVNHCSWLTVERIIPDLNSYQSHILNEMGHTVRAMQLKLEPFPPQAQSQFALQFNLKSETCSNNHVSR